MFSIVQTKRKHKFMHRAHSVRSTVKWGNRRRRFRSIRKCFSSILFLLFALPKLTFSHTERRNAERCCRLTAFDSKATRTRNRLIIKYVLVLNVRIVWHVLNGVIFLANRWVTHALDETQSHAEHGERTRNGRTDDATLNECTSSETWERERSKRTKNSFPIRKLFNNIFRFDVFAYILSSLCLSVPVCLRLATTKLRKMMEKVFRPILSSTSSASCLSRGWCIHSGYVLNQTFSRWKFLTHKTQICKLQ